MEETYTVSCTCGTPIEVDMRAPKATHVCPECRTNLKIVITVDPATQKKRVGILVAPTALTVPPLKKKGAKAPPPPAPAAPAGPRKPVCACGSEVVVDMRSMDSVYTCGWCGASYTALQKTDPATGEKYPALIRVEVLPLTKEKPKTTRRVAKLAETAPPAAPAKEKPKPAMKLGAAPPPGAPPAKTVDPSMTPAKENLFATAKGTLGAQQLVTREKGFAVFCFCGKEIEVEEITHQQIRKCPECGTSFRILAALNPKTKKKMVITIPRTLGMQAGH